MSSATLSSSTGIDRIAELLGDKAGAKILQRTLDEEAATDKKLTKLAKSTVNVRASKE